MKRGNIITIFAITSLLLLTIITAQPLIKQIPNMLFLDDLPAQTGYGCNNNKDCPRGQICVDKDTIALTIKPDTSGITSLLRALDKLSKPPIPIGKGFLWGAIGQVSQMSLMQLASETTQEEKGGKIISVYYYTKGKDSPEMREIYNKFKEKGFDLPTIREAETIKEYNREISSPEIIFYKTDKDGLIREVLNDEEGNQVRTTKPEKFKELLKEYYYVNLGCEIPPKEQEPNPDNFPEPIEVEIEEPAMNTEPTQSSEEQVIESAEVPQTEHTQEAPTDTQSQDTETLKKKICVNPDEVTPRVEPPQLPEPPQEPALLPHPATPPKPIPSGPVEYTKDSVGGRSINSWGKTWVRTEFYPNQEVWDSLLNMNPKPTKKQVYDMLKNSGMKAKIIIEYEPYLYLDTVKEKVLPKIMDGLVKPKNSGLRDEYEPSLKFTKDYDGEIFKSMVEKYTDTNYELKGYFSSTKSIPKYSEIIFMTDACGNPTIEIKINHNIDKKGNLGDGDPIVGTEVQLPNGERSSDFRYVITDEKEKQVFNKMFRGMMLFGDENDEAALTRLYKEHFD